MNMRLIERHFGDATLYLAYRFYKEYCNKPADFDELFDYLRLCKLDRVSAEIAKAIAGARRG